MNKTLLILVTIYLSGCASAVISDQGNKVRLVTTSPAGCEYLGEVSGDFRGSKTGGFVLDTSEFAHVDLKNRAADMGADTVEVLRNGDRQKSGEAYRCGRKTASY